MSLSRRVAFFLLLTIGVPALSFAGLINFDTGLGDGSPIPNGYGGLDWNTFWALNAVTYSSDPTGYLAGMVSPEFVAYNASASPAYFSSATPFTFNSVYLTGAWKDDLNIRVEGYLGAALLYDQTVVVSATTPTLFNFNYGGVDRVLFTSWGGTYHSPYPGNGEHFAMDNLTVNASGEVPEPGSGLLLITGLGALLARLARRRRVC